jgi:ABC-type transporter Mla maintaining outer membrane lipid asymmetry permease subunit MlaE
LCGEVAAVQDVTHIIIVPVIGIVVGVVLPHTGFAGGEESGGVGSGADTVVFAVIVVVWSICEY